MSKITFLDHEFKKLHSSDSVNLCSAYAGKPLLIANTASHCGFTPQFKGLEALHRKYFAGNATHGGGIYEWESRAAADAFYNDTWRERLRTVYGAAPQIEFFDLPDRSGTRPHPLLPPAVAATPPAPSQ